FILSERSSAPAYPFSWKHLLRLQLGRRAVAIVANSESGAAYWNKHLRGRRLEVIRNGLPLDLIESAVPGDPSTIGLPADARVILFAGRLAPEKNLSVLVQALGDVLDKAPDC